jgi:hypothetical protein
MQDVFHGYDIALFSRLLVTSTSEESAPPLPSPEDGGNSFIRNNSNSLKAIFHYLADKIG